MAAASCRRLIDAARCESGVTAIEYGLIAGLASVAIIAGATALGSTLDSYFRGFASYF